MRGITLLCFPPHDTAFATVAVRHLEAATDSAPDRLQAQLRIAYPGAIVRPRESFAALTGGAAWYVYRDGRFSPFVESEPPWWEDGDCAFLVVEGASGRYVDANRAALELVGLEREALLAMRTGDLVHPDARVTVPWVWELLKDTGEVHSTALLRKPDGGSLPIEYHLVQDGGGPGLHVSYMRAVPLEAAHASPAGDAPLTTPTTLAAGAAGHPPGSPEDPRQ